MQEQVGFKRLEERLKVEAAQWSHLLPQLPRLLHQALADTSHQDRLLAELRRLRQETQRRNRLLLIGVTSAAALAIMAAWPFSACRFPGVEQTEAPMSSFATRDPAQPAFWDERFAAGFTPWDARGVPPAFGRWVDEACLAAGKRC